MGWWRPLRDGERQSRRRCPTSRSRNGRRWSGRCTPRSGATSPAVVGSGRPRCGLAEPLFLLHTPTLPKPPRSVVWRSRPDGSVGAEKRQSRLGSRHNSNRRPKWPRTAGPAPRRRRQILACGPTCRNGSGGGRHGPEVCRALPSGVDSTKVSIGKGRSRPRRVKSEPRGAVNDCAHLTHPWLRPGIPICSR